MGFDIACCSIGFDGNQVFCVPRAREAIRTRCNIVDVDRQSTTFETRLIKYAMRGFRIGICGYDIKKVVNPILLGDLKPTITQFNGLARILMIINSFKKLHEFDALVSIKGRRTIESTERDLSLTEPSKKHDYSQVDITFAYDTASEGFRKIDQRVKYITNNLKLSTFFEYSLNDIQEILRPKKMNSNLSPQIEFIQIDPGQQHIGSFNPTKNNFLEHAYAPFKQKKASKYKVTVYNSGKEFIIFDAKTSAKLLRGKRKYHRDRYPRDMEFTVGTKKYTANFSDSTLYEHDSSKKNSFPYNSQGKRLGYMEFTKQGNYKCLSSKQDNSSSESD